MTIAALLPPARPKAKAARQDVLHGRPGGRRAKGRICLKKKNLQPAALAENGILPAVDPSGFVSPFFNGFTHIVGAFRRVNHSAKPKGKAPPQGRRAPVADHVFDGVQRTGSESLLMLARFWLKEECT